MKKLEREAERFAQVVRAYNIQYWVVLEFVKEAVDKVGPTIVSKNAGISRQYLYEVLKGNTQASYKTIQKLIKISEDIFKLEEK